MIDTKYNNTKQDINIKKNVQKFKSGKSKILLATNVIEEGFDVSNCNMVIVFNLIATEKSFIQLKGRARETDSEFLIFSNEKYRTQYQYKLDEYINNYQRLKKFGLNPDEINKQITNLPNLQANVLPEFQKFRIGNLHF
jgi:ERCC4-related helicase